MTMKSVVDRLAVIERYAKGKIVLDVGSAGSPYHAQRISPFDVVKRVAKEYDGLDIKSNNPKIIEGNAETIRLNKKYDVIVVGDTIEHVTNQGLLLENMQRHLKQGGYMIVTTPNIRSRWVISPTDENHVLWHDRKTLCAIGKRAGLEVDFFAYYFGNKRHFLPVHILKKVVYQLIPRLAEGLLVVFKCHDASLSRGSKSMKTAPSK